MNKRVVIALGGNALGNNLPEQMAAVKNAARAVADLIENGCQVVLSHGNGPQVGMLKLAMDELAINHPKYTVTPLSVCVAMSQGYIGYDLQNALREELLDRGIQKAVSTIITQVAVDPKDPAFDNPTKPIGRYLTEQEVNAERQAGHTVMEDAGRGWRRVVASPRPVDIVEIDAVNALLNAGQVVIAGGGGGIPVVPEGNHLKGTGAVIDKDWLSALLAQKINADFLVILTAVEKVAINFGKENQEWLDEIDCKKAEELMKEGHFAPGSMLPKVQAAVEFAKSGDKCCSLITLLDKASEGIEGKTGTRIK
ncbi:carbamate kinase [Christensenellaceae bacterium OttesenSCG-928-K19]|nr:carbamate kinase [Christensenellaceae bacterium OttesenSCG-928-K19]